MRRTITLALALVCLSWASYAQQFPQQFPQQAPIVKWVGIQRDAFNFVSAAQQQNEWCWAASVQMILGWYRIPVTQPEIVARLAGVPVNTPGSDPMITAALTGTGNDFMGVTHTIQSSHGNGLPAPVMLISELSAQHPILLAFQSGPQSGHAVVATAVAYIDTPNGPFIVDIVTRDPWPSPDHVAASGRVEYAGNDVVSFASLIRGYWVVRVI